MWQNDYSCDICQGSMGFINSALNNPVTIEAIVYVIIQGCAG